MGVNITLANGQLGQSLQTEDGVVGMVLTGAIDGTGSYALGTPILITSLNGLTEAGITDDGNEFAVRQVTNFYKEAGTGAKLYLLLVANTLTVADMADYDNDAGAKALLDYAQGEIRVLGIMSDDTAVGTITVTDGLNEDVYTALENMEVMAANYFAQQWPFRCVVGGTSYSGVPAELANLKTFSYSRSAVLVGDTTDDVPGAAIGLLLGRIAAIPVQRKVSRVKDGPAATTTAFLGDSPIENVPYDAPLIAGKGYITWQQYPREAGYYWSGDRTAVINTDDYAYLSRGRIIDKAHIIAYATLLQEVDDEVPVDPDSGKMDVGYCRTLEQMIENAINLAMTSNGEVVSITVFVDPDQNVLSTGEISVNMGIVPYGYSSVINVTLGYSNPALTS